MSAGFDFLGETFWGSNGSIESYLEALENQAAARFGTSDPLTEFFREEREGWFTGKVVFLDVILTDRARCEVFVQLLDAATKQLLAADAFSEFGQTWLEVTLERMRRMILEKVRVG